LAGLLAGVAASLLLTFAAVARGMGEMAWLNTLTLDFAVIGLLGGWLVEVWRRYRRGSPAIAQSSWLGRGPMYEREYDLSLNPLSSIESAAGLLAEDDTPTELRQELAGIISAECQRLSVSITDLCERGPAAAPSQVCEADMAAIVDSAVREAEFVLCGRGVMVCREIAPDLPPIQCDPHLIRTLITSLTIYAVQSAPPGDKVLLNARPGNDGVSLEVRDQSNESYIRRIFQRFLPLRTLTTGGSFATLYDIVRQHGGKIEAKLNIKKGLEFSVWLPLRRNGGYGSGQSSGGGGR